MRQRASRQLLSRIIKQYGVGKVISARFITIGVSDENYRVRTTRGVYFLKKHRPSTSARIESIARLEKFFKDRSLPVICPLTTLGGGWHYTYGPHAYVLYPFVTGRLYKERKIPASAVKNMAQTLARLHLLTKNGYSGAYSDVSRYFMPADPSSLLQDTQQLLSNIASLKKKTKYDYLAEQGLSLKKDLLKQYANQMNNFSFGRRQLGHGDYHPGNIFFDSRQRVSAVFDFDMAGPQPRLFDLMRAIMCTCFDNIYSRENFKKAKIFITQYYQLYPFTKGGFKLALEAFYFKEFDIWREKVHYRERDIRNDKSYFLHLSGLRYLSTQRNKLLDELYQYTRQ
jgi:Ser/Thr protein kinase RdoA (MazF antagonist)